MPHVVICKQISLRELRLEKSNLVLPALDAGKTLHLYADEEAGSILRALEATRDSSMMEAMGVQRAEMKCSHGDYYMTYMANKIWCFREVRTCRWPNSAVNGVVVVRKRGLEKCERAVSAGEGLLPADDSLASPCFPKLAVSGKR